jgi:hypothetical protein
MAARAIQASLVKQSMKWKQQDSTLMSDFQEPCRASLLGAWSRFFLAYMARSKSSITLAHAAGCDGAFSAV